MQSNNTNHNSSNDEVEPEDEVDLSQVDFQRIGRLLARMTARVVLAIVPVFLLANWLDNQTGGYIYRTLSIPISFALGGFLIYRMILEIRNNNPANSNEYNKE